MRLSALRVGVPTRNRPRSPALRRKLSFPLCGAKQSGSVRAHRASTSVTCSSESACASALRGTYRVGGCRFVPQQPRDCSTHRRPISPLPPASAHAPAAGHPPVFARVRLGSATFIRRVECSGTCRRNRRLCDAHRPRAVHVSLSPPSVSPPPPRAASGGPHGPAPAAVDRHPRRGGHNRQGACVCSTPSSVSAASRPSSSPVLWRCRVPAHPPTAPSLFRPCKLWAGAEPTESARA